MARGDCETCIHYNDDDYCFDCDHFDHITYDKYEEASPEKVAEIEAERQKQMIENAIDLYIPMVISDDFRNAFNTAKQFAAKEHFKPHFICVYASADNHLVASDTRVLIEYSCEVPLSLHDKSIVRLEDDCVAVHDKPFPSYKSLFDFPGVTEPLSGIETHIYKLAYPEFLVEGFILNYHFVYFNKTYLDLIRSTLTGQITIKYSTLFEFSSVLFTGDNARVLLMPLRVKSTDSWKEVKSNDMD